MPSRYVGAKSLSCWAPWKTPGQGRLHISAAESELVILLVHVLLVLRLDYCNTLYVGLPLGLLWGLQQVQNSAAILVSGVRKYQHIFPTLAALHWLPVRFHSSFKVVVNSLGL